MKSGAGLSAPQDTATVRVENEILAAKEHINSW